ncbi:P-loop containing nucleoside triphosphate hydrolase protein [Paraphysoderma sedebokerense]|nr:P-loop containing nucleoside triphosphate hydrolase protein [Paraphysoderma sedebokerense]
MSKVLRVNKAATEALAFTNCIILSPVDFPATIKYVIVNQIFVFNVRFDTSVVPGEAGTSMLHRRWASLSLNQEVTVAPYDPFAQNIPISAYTLQFEVSTVRRGQVVTETLEASEMSSLIAQNFNGQLFTVGQSILFEFHGINMLLNVMSMEVVDLDTVQKMIRGDVKDVNKQSANVGMLITQTDIHLTKAADASLKIKGDAKKAALNPLIQPSFKFEDMGIGGLDIEFSAIFRRAFASRIFPPSIVEKLGIQHVRGILLFGPPGTGKTLMARQIAKMLNAREPMIVNGPEILNKFVGQSEENIRKLFAAAEQEYRERGDESGLHIIIFDELDAICKQRGSKNDGTGVGDSIVNQLLSKMDGVEQLNNILVIGMTNRLDMIDEALLRPGRLEVHLEISLPDEKGRVQILKIHTSKMRGNDMLAPDVDLGEIALLTKNFSGAEISGLVKSATSFAFNRHVKVGQAGINTDLENIKVTREDFIRALDEVHAAFGASENELNQCVTNGIIHFGVTPHILETGALYTKTVATSSRVPLASLLLHGPTGSGKTALAATIAMASDFPFIKLISPETMVGMGESAKINAISKVFSDSYKSAMSVIVVDDLERLLDWVPIGPRFSNSVLQALMVLLKKPPPKSKKLLIVCTTTSRNVLQQMDMLDVFTSETYVPAIQDLQSIEKVVSELKLFENQVDHDRAFGVLKGSMSAEVRFSLGVKKLLGIIEMARQDDDRPGKFVEGLLEGMRK